MILFLSDSVYVCLHPSTHWGGHPSIYTNKDRPGSMFTKCCLRLFLDGGFWIIYSFLLYTFQNCLHCFVMGMFLWRQWTHRHPERTRLPTDQEYIKLLTSPKSSSTSAFVKFLPHWQFSTENFVLIICKSAMYIRSCYYLPGVYVAHTRSLPSLSLAYTKFHCTKAFSF